jgi:hypothetical protein
MGNWLALHLKTAVARAKQLLARTPSEDRGLNALSARRLVELATVFALWAFAILVRLLVFQTTTIRPALYEWVVSLRGDLLALIFALLTAVLGLSFSVWKKKSLLSYSLAEIAFGFFLAVQIGYRVVDHPGLADFLASASSLYVMARGFSNHRDAKEQANKAMGLSLTSRNTAMRDTEGVPYLP